MSASAVSLQSVATDVATHSVRIENCEKRQDAFELAMAGRDKQTIAILATTVLTLLGVVFSLVKH